MEWGSYELEKSKDGLKYGFFSNGPRGRIRKEVRFQLQPAFGQNVYNLAFGDFDEGTNRINDKIVSIRWGSPFLGPRLKAGMKCMENVEGIGRPLKKASIMKSLSY
jgi:hypothetical protein